MDEWHAVLLTIVAAQFLVIGFGFGWSVFREMYYRRLCNDHSKSQTEHSGSLNVIIRDVTAILTDVMNTMSAAMKAVDGSNAIAKETHSSLVGHFNQFETRLTQWLQRFERASINNNFTGTNNQGDIGQAAGKIEENKVADDKQP